MKVMLNSMDKIKDFVDLITQYETDIDLGSGKYVVDAKSILGILSLNLVYPVEVVVHDENLESNIFESLKAFMA